MERVSKCRLPMICCKTFSTLVLIIGFTIPSAISVHRYKRVIIRQSSGSFSSPGYPNPYPQNVRYEWIFPYNENIIVVDFIEMDLYRCYTPDDDQDCLNYDYVIVEFGSPYCNWYKPSQPLKLGPRLETRIIFQTHFTKEACRGKGFKATFKTVIPKINSTVPPGTATSAPERSLENSNGLDIEDLNVIIIIGTIVVILCLVATFVCCCHRKVKNRRNQQRQQSECQNRDRTSSYSAIPQVTGQQREITSGRHFYVHVESPPPIQRGPPPTYDLVANTDYIEEFESPPSYDSVIRNTLSDYCRRASQRSNRSRESTNPQRRSDRHNDRRNRLEDSRSNAPQSRESQQDRRVPVHSHDEEIDGQRTVNRGSNRDQVDPSLSRDAIRVARTCETPNQDADNESRIDRETGGSQATNESITSNNTIMTPYNQNHTNSNSATLTGISGEGSQENDNLDTEITESRGRSSDETNGANSREIFV